MESVVRSKHSLSCAVAAVAAAALVVVCVSAACGFTFVAIPDIQNETDSTPAAIQSQVDWVLNNRVSQNIAFVAQQGDLTNLALASEFSTAQSKLFQLSGAGGVPWSTCAGNHDLYDGGGVGGRYNTYFGAANFAGKSWYGGATSDGMGSYQTFQAEGRNYLVLDIGYDAPVSVLNWAQGVINTHLGMPTIINTHDYLQQGPPVPQPRSPYGDTMWNYPLTDNANGLVNGNPQVFMVLCGHNWPTSTQTSIDAAGKPVFELQADYQDPLHAGGDGYMRLYQFDEADSEIHVVTYSPYDATTPYLPNTSWYSPGTYPDPELPQEYDQFDITMNFNDRLGAAVPEPPALVLAALGAMAILGYGWRRRR